LEAAARMMREAVLPERIATKLAPGPSGCWLWTAAVDADGYGRVRWLGRNALAHRVVYELLRGPIPAGLTLDHLCRNRACVNPDHLQPVALATNVLRGEGVGVRNAEKTHCKHGHPFDAENTYIKQGKRACRQCGREANRRARARKAALG
jgi:hypothetical protein